jgi:Leucine-rich repeat (LRR) protein
MIGYGEDKQIEEFEHELNSLTNLTELNLRANNIKKLGGFCGVFKNLILLDLSDNDFYNSDYDDDDDDNEINNLVSSLSNNTSLLFLNLSENDIGPLAAKRIVYALEKCTGLQSLDLSVNQIDYSVGPIEKYCKNNFPALIRLYIDDNKKHADRYNNDL